MQLGWVAGVVPLLLGVAACGSRTDLDARAESGAVGGNGPSVVAGSSAIGGRGGRDGTGGSGSASTRCEDQFARYAAFRAQVLSSPPSCRRDEDCGVFYDQTTCAHSCGVVTNGQFCSFGCREAEELSRYAAANCDASCLGPEQPCPMVVPRCSPSGECF